MPETTASKKIVERFNLKLAQRLLGAQFAQEMLMAAHGSSERSAEWVKSLPLVLVALNNESTRLLGIKPKHTIMAVKVAQIPSTPARRAIGLEETMLSYSTTVHYLNLPDEFK